MIASRSRQTTVAANHLVRIRLRVRIREGLGTLGLGKGWGTLGSELGG